MPTLQDLPLPLAVIVFSFWMIQRLNDEHAKKLVELIAQFTEKYMALYNRAVEERQEARERWLERDRVLIATLVESQKANQDNAQQTHNLRTTLAPLVLWWETERRSQSSQPGTRKTSRHSTEDADAAN